MMGSPWAGEAVVVLREADGVAHCGTQPGQLRLQLPAMGSGLSELILQSLGFLLGQVSLSAQLAGPRGSRPQRLL